MKLLRAVILILTVSLTVLSSSFADEIRIPFNIKENKFKKELKAHGMNMNRNDDNSDGYVDRTSHGFSVFTNKPVTLAQLDIIKNASFKAFRK